MPDAFVYDALRTPRGKGKPEKKPSIRAQLKADKEKAQKKAAAKTKNHDLEV